MTSSAFECDSEVGAGKVSDVKTRNKFLGIYDDILFLFNLEFFLYDHDQIFKTRINLDISDGFDKIQQQEQDIVLE